MPISKELYYITHIDNLPSILEKGILCHSRVDDKAISPTSIYDEEIISHRRDKTIGDAKSLWEYANLYFNPRNPMLYRVKCEHEINDIAILVIALDIVNRSDLYITDGNAAHSDTCFFSTEKNRSKISLVRKNANVKWWNKHDDSKRTIMAECLVPDRVSPEKIKRINVPSSNTKLKVEERIGTKLDVIVEPWLFFKPYFEKMVTGGLRLALGDMFYSRLHTLTISVNCVGVMGKGLASTAKYRFPDAYVRYQDLCKEGKIALGKPALYKRRESIDLEMADEPKGMQGANAEDWFLFFPTKNHWKEKTSIESIENGLRWILKNYKGEGIKSLAVPSLGCGLGGLSWSRVGPVLCKYLSQLDIDVSIYLPLGEEIPEDQKSKEFLLKN